MAKAIVLLRKNGSKNFFRFWTEANTSNEAKIKTQKYLNDIKEKVYHENPFPIGYEKLQGAYLVSPVMIGNVPYIDTKKYDL